MANDTVIRLQSEEATEDPLTEMLRSGAERLVRQAVEAELAEALAGYAGRRDALGRAAVVRNGYLPEREILTGLGALKVRVPKVRARDGERAVFRSSLVPPYVRRAKRLDAALPWLYLKGISTGRMSAGAAGASTKTAGSMCGPTASTAACARRGRSSARGW